MTDPFRSRLEQALGDTYTFESELGGGGMSRTYLAYERSLDRRVVVKVLAPELLEGLSVERFKREVLMAAKLQHPHVVPVLSSGDADGLPWFSMPFVAGESLRLRMLRGPIPLDEAMGILRDVARALAYAHGQGIVHRDIKPDNVLLSGGSATVTDFGIAKAISASRGGTTTTALTQAGMAIGTPAYMAPEQVAADPNLDHRADLYAFGAMAYELLAGEQMFAGRTPARVLAAHLGEVPRNVLELQPATPTELAALIMQCLAKEPDARPADANAIVRQLDAVYTSGGASGLLRAVIPRLRLARALAIWGAIAVVVVGGVWAAREFMGLPDWALSGAVGIVLAGLPAVLGTWWVQRAVARVTTSTPTLTPGGSMMPAGTMATIALKASPHVSWTRTWRAGAISIGALVLLVSAFVATRALGVGPAASLIGKGAFGERETIVVADFRPPQDDSLIGTTVGEALRTDLAQSANLAVLTRATVRDILDRMQRPRESVVYFPLAREIATREGARAIVDGEIVRLGTSYVISARLVSSLDGLELATFRETAQSEGALVTAVGELSRSIRERVGESLKGIRRTSPLERVTTSSLPALRKYVEATQLQSATGNDERALQLLEEAVALDSTFAMAWRRLSVILNNSRQNAPRAREAVSTAMRFRDRLSDEERAFTEAYYYTRGPEPDLAKAIAAYEEVLSRDSTNSTALNNISVTYLELRRYDDAATALRRSVTVPSATGTNHANLVATLLALRDTAGADSAAAAFAARLPGHRDLWKARGAAVYAKGRLDSAAAEARAVVRASRSRSQTQFARGWLSDHAARRGRPLEWMANLAAMYELQFAGARTGTAAMWATADSAMVAAFWEGNAGQARALLKRATAPAVVSPIAPSQRAWFSILRVATYAEDTTAARIAYAGYARDQSTSAMMRAHDDAIAKAYVAISSKRFDEGIAQLRLAIAERASPDREESFLMAMSHERAGRPDSAITWLERAIATPSDGTGDGTYLPVAKRRLAELLDAKGDLRGALRHYEAFLADWTNPEPEQATTVRTVKARVAELRAKLAPG